MSEDLLAGETKQIDFYVDDDDLLLVSQAPYYNDALETDIYELLGVDTETIEVSVTEARSMTVVNASGSNSYVCVYADSIDNEPGENMGRFITIAVLTMGLLAGCSTPYFKNTTGYPQSTMQYHYNQDRAQCLKESYSAVPNQVNGAGVGGWLGSTIAITNGIDSGQTDMARNEIYNACMSRLGWYQVAKPN